MKIDIITIFPEMFEGPFSESIIKRAKKAGVVEIELHNLRKWATGIHKKVDDRPFGGGGGMIMMVEPIDKALQELRTENSIVIATTAKGETYKQSKAKEFAGKLQNEGHLIILCGHYEGIDQRVLDELVDEKISIGNYVLTGGEIPAMVIVDSVVRLLPGAVGNEATPKNDSFYEDDKTIQYPIYTRPEVYELKKQSKTGQVEIKNLSVPKILLSGNHAEINRWRETAQ